jgi:hypothetical protein
MVTTGKELAARARDSGRSSTAAHLKRVRRLVAFMERKCKPHNYLAHLGNA